MDRVFSAHSSSAERSSVAQVARLTNRQHPSAVTTTTPQGTASRSRAACSAASSAVSSAARRRRTVSSSTRATASTSRSPSGRASTVRAVEPGGELRQGADGTREPARDEQGQPEREG